jgi:PleD family two-component response regulator
VSALVDQATRPELATGTVLVVDDDEAMRETAVEILGDSGIDAVGAASAAQALALRPEVASRSSTSGSPMRPACASGRT